MSPDQLKLYWANLNAVLRARNDLTREEFHRLHNLPASTKDFTKAHMDTFLAACAAIIQPANLKPQLRSIDQPKARLLHTILVEQAAQLHALDKPDPSATIAKISKEKFRGRLPADLSDSPRSVFNSQYSELEMLRFTIARMISELRQKQGWTVHELLWQSGLGKTCQCAACRSGHNSKKVGSVAPRGPSVVDHQVGDTPGFLEDLHADNVPF